MWVLRSEPRSSQRIASVHNLLAISPSSGIFPFKPSDYRPGTEGSLRASPKQSSDCLATVQMCRCGWDGRLASYLRFLLPSPSEERRPQRHRESRVMLTAKHEWL